MNIIKKIKNIFYILPLFFLLSCDRSIIDYDNNLTRKEVKEIMESDDNRRNSALPIITRPTPPNISKLLVAPPPPPMGNGELISFSVTEDVPIKDVLIELGRIADIDIEVDPKVSGGIILKVTNKTLDVVVNRICDLANLRWSYTNNILRFEKDTPYSSTYKIDFLIDGSIWSSFEKDLNDIIEINKTSEEGVKEPKLTVNKDASLITLYANERTQKAVQKYIEYVKENYSAQVLIEAKVVEVTLKDDFDAGINWSKFNATYVQGDNNTTTVRRRGSIDFNKSLGNFSETGGVTAALTLFSGELTGAVTALQEFGLTKTLSSPRVHAMNNQKAELKFVEKLIYFSLEKEEETDSNGEEKTTYTSTKQEEDIGVNLQITPSINLKTNEITLNVAPELKTRTGWVSDPTNELNRVPVITTKSIKTSMKIKSGNILVIGGLMSEDATNEDTGIPILSSIPILGWLFKTTSQKKEVKENVIFIKATIITPNGLINDHDKKIHNFFQNKNDFLKQ